MADAAKSPEMAAWLKDVAESLKIEDNPLPGAQEALLDMTAVLHTGRAVQVLR